MTNCPAQAKRPLEGAEYKQAAKHLKLSSMLASSGLNIHRNAALPTVEYSKFSSSEETKSNQGLSIPSFEVMYRTDPCKSSKTIKSPKVPNPVLSMKNTAETKKRDEINLFDQGQISKVPVLSLDISSNFFPSPSPKKFIKKKVHLADGRKACPECDEIKKNLIEMLIHLKEKHVTSERPYPCPQRTCQRFFILKEDVQRHFWEQHRDEKRSCKRCYCRLRKSNSEICYKCSEVMYSNSCEVSKAASQANNAGTSGEETEFLMPPPNLSVVQFTNEYLKDSKYVDLLRPAAGVAEVESISLADTPIKEWLSRIGVSECSKGLHDEGVENLAQLLELTNQDIFELARSHKWKLLHRRRLLTEREKLIKQPLPAYEANSNCLRKPSYPENPQEYMPTAQTELTSPISWIFSLPPLEIVSTKSVSPQVSQSDKKEESKVESKIKSPIGLCGIKRNTPMDIPVEPSLDLKERKSAGKLLNSRQVHLPDGRKACPECPVIKKNLINLLIHLKEKHEDIGLPLSCPRQGCPRFFVLQEDADEHFLNDHVPKLASGMSFNKNLRQAFNDMLGSKKKTKYYEELYKQKGTKSDERTSNANAIPKINRADPLWEPLAADRAKGPQVAFSMEKRKP